MNKFRCYTGKSFYADFEAHDEDMARLMCVERYGKCLGVARVVDTQKPFDITKHEWSDVIAEIEAESGHTLVLKFKGSWISLDKDDAIAIARDRGLTAEDLK